MDKSKLTPDSAERFSRGRGTGYKMVGMALRLFLCHALLKNAVSPHTEDGVINLLLSISAVYIIYVGMYIYPIYNIL